MELKDFINLIGRKKATITYIVLLFLVISLILTFVQPLKYSSTSKLLVVQKYSTYYGYDVYTTAKSNEYISNILSNVISSYSFYNEVKNSGFAIDYNYFQGDNNKQMKIWQKTVSAKPIADSGAMEINVYHTDKNQANEISRAINEIIKTKHMNYDGLGDRIDIIVIDQPIVSSFPVKPNIAINILLGIALGLVFALGYIYVLPDEAYSWRLGYFFNRYDPNDQTFILGNQENYPVDQYGQATGNYNWNYQVNSEGLSESQIPVRNIFEEPVTEVNIEENKEV